MKREGCGESLNSGYLCERCRINKALYMGLCEECSKVPVLKPRAMIGKGLQPRPVADVVDWMSQSVGKRLRWAHRNFCNCDLEEE